MQWLNYKQWANCPAPSPRPNFSPGSADRTLLCVCCDGCMHPGLGRAAQQNRAAVMMVWGRGGLHRGLGPVRPTGHGLDTPAVIYFMFCLRLKGQFLSWWTGKTKYCLPSRIHLHTGIFRESDFPFAEIVHSNQSAFSHILRKNIMWHDFPSISAMAWS